VEDKRATTIEAGLHDLGPKVLPNNNEKIIKRIGVGNHTSIIEELKAETVGMKILLEGYKGQIPEDIAKKQFIAKIAYELYVLANKSEDEGNFGARYHWPAVKIISELLDKGVIQETEKGYIITDPVKGIKILAKIGDEIIALYANPETTQEKISAYYQSFKGKKKDPKFAEFLTELKKTE
jgi:hypothetical protein